MNEVAFSTTDILSDAHYPMQDLIRRVDHALGEDHKLGQKATACTCTAQDKKITDLTNLVAAIQK